MLDERGLTQFKFCQDLGIDRSRFFRDKHRPRYVYMAIAYYFGMDVDDLMEGTEAVDDFYDN